MHQGELGAFKNRGECGRWAVDRPVYTLPLYLFSFLFFKSLFAKRTVPGKGVLCKVGAMKRQRYPSDLTDEQWELAQTLIPTKTGGRPREVAVREILDAYFYLLRGGVSWRMLPHDFPAWQTVYCQVRRWKLDGVWQTLLDRLRDEVRLADGTPTQPSAAALDSPSVKSADHPRSRGFDAGTT